MMNRQNVINGNTVMVPDYKPFQPEKNQEFEKLKKAKLENNRKNKQKRVNNKAKTIGSILLTFVIGIAIIYRYSTIYNMQKELNTLKSDKVKLERQYDNLNVELLKVSNIENVKKIAEEKLHMVSANKNQVIYSDLTKDNFTKLSNKNNSETQASLMQRIKNMLF